MIFDIYDVINKLSIDLKIFDFYQDIVQKLRHEIMVTYVHQTL